MMTKTKTVDDVRLLGDYKMLKQLGQGSLGTVWVAEHRFTKKKFALKILPEELSQDRGFLARFEEEIAQVAALEHPNIAKVYTVSNTGGVFFLLSECIVDILGESTNLWHYFHAKGRLIGEEELFAIATQIASGLDYAHTVNVNGGKKLAHMALKFNNILIGQDANGALRCVLTDFGLAKIIGIGACVTRSFKAMGEALGVAAATPPQKIGQDHYPFPSVDSQRLQPLCQSFVQNFQFLAPEQKRLECKFDEKADIWAFGVLIYFLLMNEFPEGIFPLPSVKYTNTHYNWDLIIKECLNPNPELRCESLSDLLLKSKGETCPCPILEAPCTDTPQPEIATPQVESPSNCQLEFFHVPEAPKKEFSYPYIIERIVKEYQPEKREAKNVKPLQTDMVVISGGYYFRGSNCGCRDEMPRHKVLLSSFALDIHPVTNEQFVCYLDAIGEEKDSQNHDIIKLKDSRIKKSAGRFLIEPGYGKHPVVGVTWYGAIAYAAWVGKRLPTEAEWEIACCGDLENPLYFTGESIEKTEANFFSSDTTAVMSYPPNGLGLYDMAGNVYEWCHDWYEYSYYEASAQEPDFPKGPLQGVYRVLRGGCWKSLKEDLRCSKRHRNNPGSANGTYGFRCAMDVQDPSIQNSENTGDQNLAI
jgi:formylglycine-generating enzyme required for sulfatase activity